MKPEIRFKGFEEEWKETTIGNIADVIGGGTPSTSIDEYWNGDIQWFTPTEVGKNKYVGKSARTISEEGLKKSAAKLLPKGTLLLSSRATIGEVSIAETECCTNQGFQSLIVKNIDRDFLYSVILTKKEEMKRIASGSTFLEISANKLRAIPLYIPSKCEQQEVGRYFGYIDKQISSVSSRLTSLRQVKEASLQAMFPQEGENVPRIRFKGFEGEWAISAFSDMFIFLKNNSLSRAQLSQEGEIGNVHYGDVLIKFGELLDLNKESIPFIADNKTSKKLYSECNLLNGDIIFADAAEDNTVGKCTEMVIQDDQKVVSGLHTIPCRPRSKFASGFLGYALNANSFHDQLLPQIQGSKISSISRTVLRNTQIKCPKDIKEQTAIASYFRSLDRQISLQSQRLEKLKQIKAACLDKMFV
jgi:type I restriction enzyme S subunit